MGRKGLPRSCKRGHLEILMWLKEMGCPTVSSRMTGRFELAKWKNDFLITHPPTTSDDNSLKTIVDLIMSEEQVVRETSEEWLGKSSKVAAKGGHLKVLQWGFETKYFHFGKPTVEGAAGPGHLDIVKWLVEGDPSCEWEVKAMYLAARGGHIEVMKFLLEKHIDPLTLLMDPRIMNEAAGGGHIEVMKWLKARAGPSVQLIPEMCYQAAWNGRVDMLDWLKSEGCSLTTGDSLLTSAATGGQLATLKWLREQQGAPFDNLTADNAVYRGHWEVLKWLIEKGCLWGMFGFHYAVSKGWDLEKLRWMKEKGCRLH